MHSEVTILIAYNRIQANKRSSKEHNQIQPNSIYFNHIQTNLNKFNRIQPNKPNWNESNRV